MKTHKEESEEFRKYREQVHGVDTDNENRPTVKNKAMQTLFALIMIVVYVGVGILLLLNMFRWNESLDVVRWIVGVCLIIYGIFRAFRYYKGYR